MQKLTEINIGGNNYNMAGCALTGVCATAAADYIKAVTLSDGEKLFDGMAVIVAFANGNTAGNAPNAQTIYSSDQVTYYSDAELTQPFTLAPSGCYTIEYTGTGNAYTYLSYPIITIGSITGRVCDGRGKPVSGSLWSAGDRVVFIYSGGDFFILTAVDSITSGNMCAVTSNAVAGMLGACTGVIIPICTAFQSTYSTAFTGYKIIGSGHREYFNSLPNVPGKTKKVRLLIEANTESSNLLYVGYIVRNGADHTILINGLTVWGGNETKGYSNLVIINDVNPEVLDAYTSIDYRTSDGVLSVSIAFVLAQVYYE